MVSLPRGLLALKLTLGLVGVWRDSIRFVYEDNRWLLVTGWKSLAVDEAGPSARVLPLPLLCYLLWGVTDVSITAGAWF